jgi:hypothetical protein
LRFLVWKQTIWQHWTLAWRTNINQKSQNPFFGHCKDFHN